MSRLLKIAALAALLVLAASGSQAAAPTKSEIGATIQRAMEVFHAPGMAVAVVYDGKLWYAGGAGLREVGKRGAVDEHTLFQIASVSKAFTAAALAELVDDGKLDWDGRVIDYLPEFRMYDPWVTREFTVRDLLTHRSGLPLGAGDLLMFPEGNATRADIIRAMRFLKPATSFRSEFAYDNLMYIIAGEVVARVSGMPFEDFVEQRLLAPLGMADCTASRERMPKGSKAATPHLYEDGEYQVTNAGAGGLIAAAGGVTCSAASMARWLQFVLDKGETPDGEQLISPEQFRQLLSPVTILPVPGYMAEHAGSFMNAYALGWDVSTFYGQPMYSHSGGLWGMTTYVAVLPRQGLAVFASDNQMSVAPRAVVNDLLDKFLVDTVPDAGKDWIVILNDLIQSRQAAGEEAVAKAMSERAADSTPSLPLEAYAGAYRDPWYGTVHIELREDGRLWFRSDRNPPLTGPLEHFQYDTFIARWTNRQLRADAYVSFSLDLQGKVDRVKMKAVSPNTDFSYDFRDLDLVRVESEGTGESMP